MNFKDLIIKKFNSGLERGASRRLAKEIGYAEGSVAKWMRLEAVPGEEIRPRLAKMLDISVEELMESFKSSQAFQDSEEKFNLKRILTAEEWDMLNYVAENDMRDARGMIRWLVRSYATKQLVPPPPPQASQILDDEIVPRRPPSGGGEKLKNPATDDKKRASGSDRK